ncbi:MAG TPA: DUF4115 domain-containing protein [Bryobacteraceae bacterium]|nr:DUF4115 domain-containing protein [Bryobacteraceae bacterium]
MARLRVRVELNRGGVGVPLHKLASVVHEAQTFFQMLAQDVHIENRGEWLGFDFDNESLNFTAEYVGPVSPEQVQAFCAAFDGVTSLRRATIAQFTRIADAIGEDELIGFGLYQSDQEAEPGEWRCLSRRDALRIADEIQLLLGAAGEQDQATHLPAVIDTSAGARLFKDRRDRAPAGLDPTRLPELVRDVESSLTKRITRIEGEIENQSQAIRELRDSSTATEESFRGLLSTVENFCGQATRQLERMSPPAQLPAAAPAAPPPPPEAMESSRRSWRALLIAAVVLAVVVAAAFVFWPSASRDKRSLETTASAAAPVVPAKSEPAQPSASSAAQSATTEILKPTPAPGPSMAKTRAPAGAEPSKVNPPKPSTDDTVSNAPAQPDSEVMRVDMEAQEPVWVMVTDVDGRTLMARTLQPNETRSLELTKAATLRTGNAGGLRLRLNGQDIGRLGPSGKIRDVRFKDGTFKIISLEKTDNAG